MNNVPKFSVIIPVYNVKEYLGTCLESVLNQTFADWEAICVDDGSSDGGSLTLEEFAKRDARIKVIRQSNAGVGAARNNGLSYACGEFVLFLDADDALMPMAMHELYNIFQSKNVDAIIYGYESVDSQNDKVMFSRLPIDCYSFQKKSDRALAFGKLGIVLAWNLSFRRKSFEGLRFNTNLPIGEDSLWGVELICRCNKMAVTAMKLYKYTQRGNSAVHTISLKGVFSQIESYALRHAILHKWFANDYSSTRMLRKYVRSSYVGQIYSKCILLADDEVRVAWARFSDVWLKLDRLSSFSYFVLRTRSRILFNFCFYIPFKFRVLLLRSSLVCSIRDAIRTIWISKSSL